MPGMILPKASATGIKVDPASPDYGWKDLLGVVEPRPTGATVPSFTVLRDGIYEHQFDSGDEEFYRFHLPHDYVLGTHIYIHAHWVMNNASPSGAITWGFEHIYAKSYDQEAFPASKTLLAASASAGAQYRHMIAEVQLSNSGGTGNLMDTALLEPDGILHARLHTNATTLNADPFVMYVDLHYQSTQLVTKQRNTPFYT